MVLSACRACGAFGSESARHLLLAPEGHEPAHAVMRVTSHPSGRRRPDSELPRLIRRLRGHSRGRFRTGQGQHPPCPAACPTLSAHAVSRIPMGPLRFVRMLPNRTLRVWAESRAGSDPPPIYGSTAPPPAACNAGCLMFGVAPSPRRRRASIPAGRPQTRPCGGWRRRPVTSRPPRGPRCGRRHRATADRGRLRP